MQNKNRVKVKEDKVEYDEFAEELFTHNFRCPHCNKSLSLSLSKLRLENLK